MDLTERVQTNQGSPGVYFDGTLCPTYNEVDIESLDIEGSLSLSVENKEFTPVIHMHNNQYLISSFQKKDTSVNPPQIVYGFQIFLVPEDCKVELGDGVTLLYSSESMFQSTSKINHITVVERESDGLNLICINREDGYIYMLNYFVNEENEFLIELENTIVPQIYEGQISSMRRLGYSDFLTCTNTRGEILTLDTIRCELAANEKSSPWSPSL